MGEIEAQPRRFHHAAGLLHMRPEYLPQRRMQQVRRRVVAHGSPAFGDADLGPQFIANPDFGKRADLMNRKAGNAGPRVFHNRDHLARVRIVKRSAIANLTAGLGVKRRLIEHHLGIDTRRDPVDKLLIHQQTLHG